MSTTDHTLTDAERAMFERIEDTGDTQGLTWRVQELVTEARALADEESASRVALANQLATAEAEKEALRERVGRLEAQLAEVRRTSRVLPCDGLCSEYPEEDCSLHGREPAELWEAIAEKNKHAEAAEAALAGLVAAVEALAEASLQDGRGGAWVHDVWFRAPLDADHAAALRAREAKVLREAADAWAEGEWNDAFASTRVVDDLSAVQAMETWLHTRADSIEQARP